MSSPIALQRKAAPKKALVSLHRSLSHGHRIDVLAQHVVRYVESLVPQGPVRCIDIGCGDMTLAEAIQERAPRTDWTCIDVHDLPEHLRDDARWRKYGRFDGRTVPHGDAAFDVAMLCDVLHHAPADAARLLAEAGRVARHVLVKDHFEYGPYSRTMLRLMDFVGNWGYGIGIPERYFTREGFAGLVAEQRLVISALDCGLEIYQHLPVVGTLLRPDWQFIAVLRRG